MFPLGLLSEKGHQFMPELINDEKNHEYAYWSIKTLRNSLDKLCRDHLVGERERQKDRLESLEVDSEMVKDCQEKGIIGGSMTLIGLKDHNSYLIRTLQKGLRLYENGNLIFSQYCDFSYHFEDIVYVQVLNCYLISCQFLLLRKKIDGSPPEIFWAQHNGNSFKELKYSKLNKKLIFVFTLKNISVVDPITLKVEIEIDLSLGGWIKKFRVIGDKEDRVVVLTNTGYVVLYWLDFARKKSLKISLYQLNLNEEKREEPWNLAVCDKSEYLFVEIRAMSESSRMIILRRKKDKLTKVASVEQDCQNMIVKQTVECFGYVGRHILWCMMTNKDNGILQFFDYDPDTQKFRELEGNKVYHHESWPDKLHRLDDKLYYIGRSDGKLRCLTMNF